MKEFISQMKKDEYTRLTDEQKEAKKQKMRNWYNNLSEEKKQEWSQRTKDQLANRTAEEWAIINRKNSEGLKRHWSTVSDEDKKKRIMPMLEAAWKSWDNLSPEEKRERATKWMKSKTEEEINQIMLGYSLRMKEYNESIPYEEKLKRVNYMNNYLKKLPEEERKEIAHKAHEWISKMSIEESWEYYKQNLKSMVLRKDFTSTEQEFINLLKKKGGYFMSTKLTWKNIATVAPQKGYDKNLGTAGLVKGVLGSYLIFGGGANFEDGILPVDGGVKINHKDVYLYKEINGNLSLVDQIQYDYPLAYGPSAVADNKLYYIATKEENLSEILVFTVVDDKLVVNVFDTLPFTVENTIAEVDNNILYFGIGSINGKNTNELYSYNLCTKDFDVIGEFPGKLRSQTISCIYNNELYIYGGGADVTFNDGYKFNLTTKTWEKLADVVIDNEEISLLGADWAPLNENEMLVIGGFFKKVL